MRLLARQQQPAESVEAARQAVRAAMDKTQVGRARVVGQAGVHAATGRQQHGAGEDGATESITVRGSTLPTPPQNSPPPPPRTAAQLRAAFNRMAAVEDTSERSRLHRVSSASRRSPHSLSSVARHPTVGHAPLAAAAPLPARVRPTDRAAAAPQDRPTLNTSHDDVDARVCDRTEPTIPPASQDARAQVVVGQRTDRIPSAGWLADVDHPAAARVPDQGADRVGIIPTSVIRAGGNTHHGRPSNLEDDFLFGI
jgi:hypothetical protein